MGLFERFSGTMPVDQFVVYRTRSAVKSHEGAVYKLSKDLRAKNPELYGRVRDLKPMGKKAAAESLDSNIAQINADLRTANLEALTTEFLDEQGQTIGRKVQGRHVAGRTSIIAIGNEALKKYGFESTRGTAYHRHIPLGSDEHKQVLKMLKRDRIGRAGLKQARRSNSFIFLGPGITQNVTHSDIYPTKVALHEIGHATSKTAELHGARNSVRLARNNQLRSMTQDATGNLDELFEMQYDAKGNPIGSRLDRLKTVHFALMRETAREEARAEGFSHQMLDRIFRNTPDSSLNEYSLLDQEIALRAKAVSLEKLDELPGRTLSRMLSYSSVEQFEEYSKTTFEGLETLLTSQYGEDSLKDPRIQKFIDSLKFSGKTLGQRTVLGSVDSPVLTKIPNAVESLITLHENKMIEDVSLGIKSQKEADFYSKAMSPLLNKSNPINKAGEIAAHAAMTTESAIDSLLDDASKAATAVLDSAVSTSKEGLTRASKRGIRITSGTTAENIISGVQTAMKVAGIIK